MDVPYHVFKLIDLDTYRVASKNGDSIWDAKHNKKWEASTMATQMEIPQISTSGSKAGLRTNHFWNNRK